MRFNFSFSFLIVLTFLACTLLWPGCKSEKSGTAPDNAALMRYFTGEWVSEELEVRIDSYGNTDSSVLMHATKENWDSVMNELPIHTIFMADHSYRSEYRDLDSNITKSFSGVFEVDEDSIILHILKPNHLSRRHAWVQINDSLCGFSSIYDADLDGKKDDEYFSLLRKIAN